jgi:hypothetical protein
MSSQHRKHRGFRTERVIVSYLQTWWRSASIGRGAGKDIHNVPFDIEVKARSDFQPLAWIKQVEKRAQGKELSAVVCRMNTQGEDAGNYLAFMRFQDLVDLLLRAGYGDIQQESVQLEPDRCAQCGSWILKGVPCRTCEKLPNANL